MKAFHSAKKTHDDLGQHGILVQCERGFRVLSCEPAITQHDPFVVVYLMLMQFREYCILLGVYEFREFGCAGQFKQ